MTNPFCKEAFGARWPDNTMMKTLNWDINGLHVGLRTDVNGAACYMFLPHLVGQYVEGVVTGQSVDFQASPVVAVGDPPTPAAYRLTSYGLKIAVETPPLTTQGFAIVKLYTATNMTSLHTMDLQNAHADAMYTVPLARLINDDLFVIPAPMGDQARLWNTKTPSSGVIFNDLNFNPGFQIITVSIVGAMTDTVAARARLYYHYEVSPADSDSSMQYAKAAPKQNLALQQGSAGVLHDFEQFVEGTAEKVDTLINSKAAKFLSRGATYLLGV